MSTLIDHLSFKMILKRGENKGKLYFRRWKRVLLMWMI